MMKKRLMLPLIACLLLLAASLTACSGGYTFAPYSYTNKAPIPADIHDFTSVDGMTVDGVRDAQYGDAAQHRLYYKNNVNSDIYVDAYLYFGDEGIHCFVSVKDNILSFNANRSVYLNSSVELFFNATQTKSGKQKTSIDNATCQWRIDCGGKSAKLCGIGGRNAYTGSYFDGQFAVNLNGELNSQDATGFDVETFIPWYELGFTPDENGDYGVTELMFNVAYNHKDDPYGAEDNTSRARSMKTFSYQATPYTWVPLAKNADGTARNLTSPDGNFFGTLIVEGGLLAGVYEPTYLVDLSQDNDEGGNKMFIRSDSPTAYAVVKNSTSSHFYYEAYLSGISGEQSNTPKIGITVLFPANRITLYIKMYDGANIADGICGVVQRTITNGGYNWSEAADPNDDTMNWGYYTNSKFRDPDNHFITEGVKLAIYREDDILCFFVNDELYFANWAAIDAGFTPLCEQPLNLHDTASREIFGTRIVDDSIVGVFSFGANATVSDYTFVKGDDASARVASYRTTQGD